MDRRGFLRLGAGLAAAPLAGCKFSFEQGLWSDCRTGAQAVLRDPLVLRAWEGLRANQVWDSHAHLFGNGRSKSGLWVNDSFDRPVAPESILRRAMFVNGGCVAGDEPGMDVNMIRRVASLADQLEEGAKVMLLAFDHTYDRDGNKVDKLTTFSVSNDYAMAAARKYPRRFEWAASVHPDRQDFEEALEKAKAGGARAVKWLPPSQDIDPGGRRKPEKKYQKYYDTLVRLDLPLIMHVGEERAVPGAEKHEHANPLHMRHPLDAGVRVIAAHCATLGESPDIDQQPNCDKAAACSNLKLFERLMDEPRYEKLLYGDISAVTQTNRAWALPTLLQKRHWHPRLLNGSDYPLPGIMPLFSPRSLVKDGLLDESALPVIRELRHVNPLLFDFVLKRNLRFKGDKFPNSVFETRGFFDRGTHGA